MKTQLKSYWQSLIEDTAAQSDEVGLGIDGMLGDDVVKLLAAIPKKVSRSLSVSCFLNLSACFKSF